MNGVRYGDSTILFQAWKRNCGNLCFDVKGEIQGVNSKNESTNAKHRGGLVRSSVEVAVMATKRRG